MFSKLPSRFLFSTAVGVVLIFLIVTLVSSEKMRQQRNSKTVLSKRIHIRKSLLREQLMSRATNTQSKERHGSKSFTHSIFKHKKQKSKIASLRKLMSTKTPGEPVHEFVQKQRKRQFTVASSGGGGRAMMQFLGAIRGYGGIAKFAEDTHMIATNSGSSWLMNRLLLEGTDGPLSKQNSKTIYKNLVNQLVGEYDGDMFRGERIDETTAKKYKDVEAFVTSSLKILTLKTELNMFVNYVISTVTGKISPEWYDFCKVRAVCERKRSRGHEHECFSEQPAPKKRVKTIWRQQIALESSGTYFKAGHELYQYDLVCRNHESEALEEMPVIIPMYLNVDTRHSNSRANDIVSVDIPYLKFKRCQLSVVKMSKTKSETVNSIFKLPNKDATNMEFPKCTIKQYEPSPNDQGQTFQLTGAAVIRSLRHHYESIWKKYPGRMSAASSSAGGMFSSPKLVESAIFTFLQTKANGKYQFGEKDISFEYLMIIKKLAMAAFNAFGDMAKAEFNLKEAFINMPNPQVAYTATVDLSQYNVPKNMNFAFSLIDGGYIDNYGISSAIYNLQKSNTESEIIVLDHTSTKLEKNAKKNIYSPAERFEQLFFQKKVHDDDITSIVSVSWRTCNRNTNSQYAGCMFDPRIASEIEKVTYEDDQHNNLFAKSFRTFRITTKENKFFGIKAGSKYTIHYYLPISKKLENIGILPPSVDIIKRTRETGKWKHGNSTYTFPNAFKGYDEFMYLAATIENNGILEKFLNSNDKGLKKNFLRFKSKHDILNYLKVAYKNNDKDGPVKTRKQRSNSHLMRFQTATDKFDLCNLVSDKVIEFLKDYLGAGHNELAKSVQNDVSRKHQLGAICKEGKQNRDYYSKLWGKIFSQLIKKLPKGVELPISGLPGLTPAMLLNMLRQCADVTGNKLARLELGLI